MQGQLDPALDDLGHRQAAAAAGVLATFRPAVLVTSDLTRATQTAQPLARACGLAAIPDRRLREVDLGGWQGLTRAQVCEEFPAEYAAWRAGEDIRRGAGETYADAGGRGSAAVREWLASVTDGGVLVAVTHGGTARATAAALLELEPAAWWRFAPLGNCRWTVLVEDPRGWRLLEHNAGDPPDDAVGDDAR